MQDDVAIWYRGANYQLGRWRHGYGIWPVAGAAGVSAGAVAGDPAGMGRGVVPVHRHRAPRGHRAPQQARACPVASRGAVRPARPDCSAPVWPAGSPGCSRRTCPGRAWPAIPPTSSRTCIYLATWLASGLLIMAGGTWRRVGALLGLGTSIVTFGYFFADLGTAISGGTSALGPGLVLGLIGWLLVHALALRWLPGHPG